MGIPTFFRDILQKNRHVIRGVTEQETCDFFFIDFNSVIYTEWTKIKNDDRINHKKHQLISNVISLIVDWTTRLIKPKEYVYIAMDGCAPRAKMVQQRSRRYKSVLLKDFQKGTKNQWEPAANISPGTPFMWELKTSIEKAMVEGRFGECQVLFSDSNYPGEGEHKFLHRLRQLRQDKNNENKKVVVFSPDNDMISLCILTQKSNIHLFRFVDPFSEYEKHLIDKGFDTLLCDIDSLRNAFSKQITDKTQIDPDRLLVDYNFLLSLVGNDFVPSLPFLKIRSGGLNLLIKIYNELRPVHQSYLISNHFQVDIEFLKQIFLRLSCIETIEMKRQYDQMQREFSGQSNSSRRIEMEISMDEDELQLSRFLHLSFFNPDHPLFSVYGHLFRSIDYSKPKHEWKADYYRYFCNFDPTNIKDYNQNRTEMVHNYLESIVFTLLYYNKGCPSWTWYYRYRVAPLPSDVYTVLCRDNRLPSIPMIPQSYTPFEQLMLILPPDQIVSLLPDVFHHILDDPRFSSFFIRHELRVDALAGGKFIYSEAILPELHFDIEQSLIQYMRSLYSNLSDHDRKRNTISNRIKKYVYVK